MHNIKYYILMAFLSFITLFIFFRVIDESHQMMQRHAPLIEAVKTVKLEMAEGHLWFEEILSGDKHASIETVWENMDSALWHAKALLGGGTSEQWVYLPLEEPFLREKMRGVVDRIEESRAILHQRYANFDSAHVGSELDQQFDRVFNGLCDELDTIEDEILKLIEREQKYYWTLLIAGIGTIFVIVLIIVVTFYKMEKEGRRLLDELRNLSITDYLTGIPNRRYFFEVGEKYFHIARRDKVPLALLLIDIDHFKKLNDAYGHKIGDTVLKLVSEAIFLALRKSDIFARIGGEEFAVLLIETDKQGAMHIAEILRREVEKLRYSYEGEIITTSVSIGIGICQDEDDTLSTFYGRTDDALYQAKEGGRNCIRIV